MKLLLLTLLLSFAAPVFADEATLEEASARKGYWVCFYVDRASSDNASYSGRDSVKEYARQEAERKCKVWARSAYCRLDECFHTSKRPVWWW